jgi:hypothetical protein
MIPPLSVLLLNGSRIELYLAANPPLFPSGTEYALREIEPFLGFCQFLLEALDTMFQRLEPSGDVGR